MTNEVRHNKKKRPQPRDVKESRERRRRGVVEGWQAGGARFVACGNLARTKPLRSVGCWVTRLVKDSRASDYAQRGGGRLVQPAATHKTPLETVRLNGSSNVRHAA